jgi:hypothetical protein
MIEPSDSRNASQKAWIVIAALLLLAVIAGLILWLNRGPSVLSAGHRWGVYPGTGRMEEDSGSETDKLAFDGNVKLISLLYSEHVA